MSSLETYPVMATRGAPSRKASATPVTRFVAPAERGQAHASATGQAPIDIGHERRALLVPRRDEADASFLDSEHKVKVLFAGDAEDDVDALRLEAVNEDLCACSGALSCGHMKSPCGRMFHAQRVAPVARRARNGCVSFSLGDGGDSGAEAWASVSPNPCSR